MSAVIGVLAVLLALAGVLAAFMRLDAARLASGLRLAGPAVLGMAGLVLLFAGRAALGGMLVSAAVAWYGAGRARQAGRKTPGKRSTVRTAALEMELDHDSGCAGRAWCLPAAMNRNRSASMSLRGAAGAPRGTRRRCRKPAAPRDVS